MFFKGVKQMPDPKALDAHQTAKPDEPTFTLQGGDPAAAPLVRLWAQMARQRCGLLPDCQIEANVLPPPENDHEREELLKRATLAEELSWDMDSYQKGTGAEEAEISSENPAIDERLDLFDLRRFSASRISGMFSELQEIHDRLEAAGFEDNEGLAYVKIKVCIANLREVHGLVELEIDRKRYGTR
jgi:hypothetical protein